MTKTYHDFNDGKGEVPAHRHRNPDGSEGGWVAETAYARPTAYIGGKARVYGEALICGKARASTTPLAITGMPWVVTITDNYMSIGCQTHAIAGWLGWSPSDVAHMGGMAEAFWAEYGDALKLIAARHALRVTK